MISGMIAEIKEKISKTAYMIAEKLAVIKICRIDINIIISAITSDSSNNIGCRDSCQDEKW